MEDWTRRAFLSASAAGLAWAAGTVRGLQPAGAGPASRPGAARPNVVYILADDLGYGDVSCMSRDAKIRTPHIDRVAAGGMTFTDAHAGSAVCTPTRYGILTGRYAWRTHLRRSVLWGFSPPLIAAGRTTVASLLKAHGYHTACLGKWHLGMDWPFADPAAAGAGEKTAGSPAIDYARPIRNGPCAVGFDHFYGISASLDMPPYCWIENDRTVGIPSERRSLWKDRIGAAAPGFVAEDVLPTLGDRAAAHVEARARAGAPFFLYLALNAPHTPVAPAKGFAGRSELGPYGDFVLQVDAVVGQVAAAIDRAGIAGDTLLVFTADNGCSPEADLPALARRGHRPSHTFRGAKADIFDGGHRVPFVARWPARVRAGATCDDPICLTDLMATCADAIGARLPDDAGEDSVSILPDLLGTATAPVREAVVHQSINGSLAVRQGKWKLCLCPDSGGWSGPKPGTAEAAGLPPVQLFDMGADPGERRNAQSEHPEVVERLRGLLQRYVDEGRSTPGRRQANDVPVPLTLPAARARAQTKPG